MTKTLEQLEEEAQKAQEALEAARLAEIEARRTAEYEKRRAAEAVRTAANEKRKTAILNNVVKALNDKNIIVKPGQFLVEIPVAGVTLFVEEKYDRYNKFSVRSPAQVGYTLRLSHGHPHVDARDRRFTIRDDAVPSAGMAMIVARIYECAQQVEAIEQRLKREEAQRNAAVNAVQQLRDHKLASRVEAEYSYDVNQSGYGRNDYRRVVPSAGKVFVSVGRLELTPEQARKVLDVLQAVGVK